MYVCPLCFSIYTENHELCPECNCDLPGDVELEPLNSFLDRHPPVYFETVLNSIRETVRLRKEYRAVLIKRLEKVIERKNATN
jgi:hypothetical protein